MNRELKEIWKPVENYEDSYEISNQGRVKSLTRIIKSKGTSFIRRGKILNVYGSGRGNYYKVKLYNGDATFENIMVHRLVAQTFIPNPENYPQVNHIDCHTLNNYVENLEWCNNSMNIQHAYDNNLINFRKGVTHYKAKLTEEDVIDIRKLHETLPFSYEYVMEKYNISKSVICAVIKRRSWKHI